MSAPRVAIAGMILESNAFAPVATEADFRGRYHFEGERLLAEARAARSVAPRELAGFVAAMDATGPWEPVPLVLTGCQPKGPVEQGFFEATVARMVGMLGAAGPVDAVYVANHGAMVATGDPDPDGTLLAALRAAAGERAVVAVTLDLHANISPRMAGAVDAMIGYRTNPHVDMLERGEEAAQVLRAALAGTARPVVAMTRLPLTPPSVTLLTAEPPYGEVLAFGERRRLEHGGTALNVSVFGGFVFGDTPENGLCAVVTAREAEHTARRLSEEIAAFAWSRREGFRRRLTPLDEAVRLALVTAAEPAAPAVIFSDAGDNPGGGGGGDTTELLAALCAAGATGVLFGSFFDPELAAAAHRTGTGRRFDATFNTAPRTEYGTRLTLPARVVALGDGNVTGRRGLLAGRDLALGPCCALALGETAGVTTVVVSNRQQTADPVFFEMLGLDPGAARVVCVKSRGHFRAGFDEWFSPEQVYEVDTAGLTSPVLERFTWRGLPRPVYPLDEDATWEGPPGRR